MTTLTIRRPDDWHLHLRDGDVLEGVLPHTSRDFARAIIMPNLVPPVVTTAQAAAYRDRILKALPKGDDFTPLMTLYLTETTDPADVEAGFRDGLITAVKLYPAGATTNSQSGVRDLDKVHPVLGKNGRDRPAALCPWRSHGPGNRHLRPRSGVPGNGSGALAREAAGTARGAGTCDDGKRRRLR
jgi:dihydroorotase